MLQGHYSQIKYRFDDNRDSERAGGSLIWQHTSSATTEWRVVGSHTEVSFDLNPQLDYTYQAGTIAYSVALSRLSYTVEVGYNETETERSEEHTSELQSRGQLVCRLLLEKKKNRMLSSTQPVHLAS